MKHEYPLSDQTRKVLNSASIADIAENFGCSSRYIYSILSESETDCFAKFEWLFSSAVKAGCDVSPWMIRLEQIIEKYRPLQQGKSVSTETQKFVKESVDVAISAIDPTKDLQDELTEVTHAITQGEILKASLIHAINVEIDAGNDSVRRFARTAVNGRRTR